MKKRILVTLILGLFLMLACNKTEENDRFELLTATAWVSDSLLVDGADASGPGQVLEKFKGEVTFNRDATGHFGQYTGFWRFADNKSQIVITTDSLPIPLTTIIDELTASSLKINTAYPSLTNPDQNMQIRMTFRAK